MNKTILAGLPVPALLFGLLSLLAPGCSDPAQTAPPATEEPQEEDRPDFANLTRYAADNATLPPREAGDTRVVFLGNSITQGWASDDPDFFTDNHFVGRGISGQTSPQLLLRFRQDVVELDPDAVVIHIGTNDVAENTGPYDEDFTVGNIKSMADIARAHGIEVIIASVLPHTGFSWRKELGDRSDTIVSLNQRLMEYARSEGLTYVDYHAAMKNADNGMDAELASDGVHPTAKGFAMMEELVLPAVRSALQSE